MGERESGCLSGCPHAGADGSAVGMMCPDVEPAAWGPARRLAVPEPARDTSAPAVPLSPALAPRTVPWLFERLGALLDYPNEHTAAEVDACITALGDCLPQVAARLKEWRAFLLENEMWSVQETYTQTFDLSPACSLDVGYYLFGEDYQRGVFMAQLRESQEELGMVAEQELPDHLPVLLRWLARVYGTELHTDMVGECILPVMARMDEALANGTNPYRGLIEAVAMTLAHDLFNPDNPAAPEGQPQRFAPTGEGGAL